MSFEPREQKNPTQGSLESIKQLRGTGTPFKDAMMSFACPREQENALSAVLDPTNVDAEHALWRAVLQRTLRDAACAHPVRNVHVGQSRVTRANQADARACLADGEWCEWICERAGVDIGWFQQQQSVNKGE